MAACEVGEKFRDRSQFSVSRGAGMRFEEC